MALDKLVDSAVLDAGLTSVADAIRTKDGTTGQLAFPDGFVEAVGAIQAGGGEGVAASWEGSVEFSNTLSNIISVPAADGFDTFVLFAYVIETGTVVDGVVTYDDTPTIPASSNRWATFFAVVNVLNGTAIPVTMGTSAVTYSDDLMGGQSMRGSASAEFSHPVEGVVTLEDGVLTCRHSARFFCQAGYYAKFNYVLFAKCSSGVA